MGPKDKADLRAPRRWLAVGLATVLMFLSYLMFIFGFASASEDEPVFAGGLLGIALGLVPAVFFAAAAVSEHERMIRATLAACGLFVCIGTPIAILDIPTGLVAGFGAGGIVAIRRLEHHAVSYRIGAVVVCVAYTFILQRLIPGAGLMVGAIIPLVAIAIADVIREREVEALSP